MKRSISMLIVFVLLFSIAVPFSSCGTPRSELNVMSIRPIISNGANNASDINRSFSTFCKTDLGIRVDVNYTVYPTAEELEKALLSNDTVCDVLIASDHIIEKLIRNELLSKLDLTNIPNFEYNVGKSFKSLQFDLQNQYSIPLSFGEYGIAYNSNAIDMPIEDISWDIFWSEAQKGKIVQNNDMRLLFASACLKKGISPNTDDHEQLKSVFDELLIQKDLLRIDGYTTEGIDKLLMHSEATVAMCSSAEALKMRKLQANNVLLRFTAPNETICYIDSICIPKESSKKELAESYINYMLRKEIALINTSSCGYASTVTAVESNITDELFIDGMTSNDVALIYPVDFISRYESRALRALSNETEEYMKELYKKLFE